MIVSRDGSSTYASAIKDSHHDAIQVSDRFHIIKGLSEAVNKYIIRVLPDRVEIPLTEAISEELQLLYNTANRSMRIQYAHKKRREGLTVSDIALLLHSTLTTINRYLAIPEESLTDNQFIAREKQHQLAMEQKQHEVDEARRLVQEGYAIEKIALIDDVDINNYFHFNFMNNKPLNLLPDISFIRLVLKTSLDKQYDVATLY
jgi:transposase